MLITLLTDFGLTDEFAGVVKGVILGICPQASVVDLSHGIEPGGVYQAGLMLAASYHYFPLGTVHCAVVDPGVGSKRRIIAANHGGHFFVAPDNGLLALALADNPPQSAVIVENSAYFLNPVSATFHGRDILGPVSAYLALPLTGKRWQACLFPAPLLSRAKSSAALLLRIASATLSPT
jgi:hypothetical protein